MSVYLFGKMFVDAGHIADSRDLLYSLASTLDIGVSINSLDDDDQDRISELAGTGSGFAFSIHSHPEFRDATALWVEAQRLAYALVSEGQTEPVTVTPNSFDTIRWPEHYDARMRKCRLAQVLDAIVSLPNYDRACVALVEGGIEALHEDPAELCIAAMLRVVILPWDCVSGVLYAWPYPRGHKRNEVVPKVIGAV